MQKFVERIFDSLVSAPLNTVGALIIFLLALPLIKKGLRDRPAQPPTPPPISQVEIESPWFVQNFLQMQQDIQKMQASLVELRGMVTGVVSLLKRRQGRKPKK